MHTSTPRPSALRTPADRPAAVEEPAAVVAGARRRAHRDGERRIDTAHLLHSLLESDPAARACFADAAEPARVLGYLVQRSIGYGLRWQGVPERSGRPTAAGQPDVPGWSPAAVAAMEAARTAAARRGDDRPHGTDVLAALAADRECRAAEVLRRARVDAAQLSARIAPPSQQASRVSRC
ncbi:Clp protease N-terminal domain-containing protein [Streptomyces sp. ODS05-4]|uniref:Clp protease N-terminal domain-containing protein n=1 Tax=Streptomyces sp. ODS05-4 TaxID=2944939 RepID=UPI00210C702F|nr:Clp protease N-terminal domain-containing protein [Streptomyces sp. ODS05-4]